MGGRREKRGEEDREGEVGRGEEEREEGEGCHVCAYIYLCASGP